MSDTPKTDYAYTCECGSVRWVMRRDHVLECHECQSELIDAVWVASENDMARELADARMHAGDFAADTVRLEEENAELKERLDSIEYLDLATATQVISEYRGKCEVLERELSAMTAERDALLAHEQNHEHREVVENIELRAERDRLLNRCESCAALTPELSALRAENDELRSQLENQHRIANEYWDERNALQDKCNLLVKLLRELLTLDHYKMMEGHPQAWRGNNPGCTRMEGGSCCSECFIERVRAASEGKR